MSTSQPSESHSSQQPVPNSTKTSPQPQPRLQTGSTALERTKINLRYLVLGSSSSVAPASITTRSLLTTTRYVIKYIVRRLIRYAKYAAVGAIVATIGSGLLGTVGSGIAFFAAPSVGVGMGIGVITAIAKFGWRHRHAADHIPIPFHQKTPSSQTSTRNMTDQTKTTWWSAMRQRANAGRDPAEDERQDAKGDKNGVKK